MEDLTRTQTVLLCLLVSFVTSIGTGIITVSLLQEAPQAVSQTINQVVERTIERVTPGGTNTVTKEVTVVVKEEDLVIDAIKKNEKSLVRIAQNVPQGAPNVVGLGIVTSAKGKILADRRIFSDGASFVAIFSDGRQWPVRIESSNEITNIARLETLSEPPYTFHPAITSNSDNLQLGQTVIGLGGRTNNQVTIGRISSVRFDENANSGAGAKDQAKPVVSITMDSPLKESVPRSMLLNLSGELVGVENWQPENLSQNNFIAINAIKAANKEIFE